MNFLKAIVDRFEEGKAVLIFSDSQKLVISKDLLPKNCQEGSEIKLYFDLFESEESKRSLAKSLLNEILKS